MADCGAAGLGGDGTITETLSRVTGLRLLSYARERIHRGNPRERPMPRSGTILLSIKIELRKLLSVEDDMHNRL